MALLVHLGNFIYFRVSGVWLVPKSLFIVVSQSYFLCFFVLLF